MSPSRRRWEKNCFSTWLHSDTVYFRQHFQRKFSSRGKLGANSTRILCRGSESILTAVGCSNEPRPCFSTRCRVTWQKYMYIYIANPPSSRSHNINIPGLFESPGFSLSTRPSLFYTLLLHISPPIHSRPLVISSSTSEIFLDSLKSVHRVVESIFFPSSSSRLKKNHSLEERLRKLKILNVVVITITFKRAFFSFISLPLSFETYSISRFLRSSREEEKKAARICVEKSLLSRRRQSEVWSGYVSGCDEHRCRR